MSIFGELEYDAAAGCWEGWNDTVIVRVPEASMIEAYHICTMRGLSRRFYYEWLHQVDTWLDDATLRGLEDVEISEQANDRP